jgi:hypothetical protein
MLLAMGSRDLHLMETRKCHLKIYTPKSNVLFDSINFNLIVLIVRQVAQLTVLLGNQNGMVQHSRNIDLVENEEIIHLPMTVRLTSTFRVGERPKSTRHLYSPWSDSSTWLTTRTAGCVLDLKWNRDGCNEARCSDSGDALITG